MNTALQKYENDNPIIVIDKNKTISSNDFELGEQYILLITDPDDEENPDITHVVYQGSCKEMGVFMLTNETRESPSSTSEFSGSVPSSTPPLLQTPDNITRNEGVMNYAFRSVSKPTMFYDILSTDIEVDCFFYKITTR